MGNDPTRSVFPAKIWLVIKSLVSQTMAFGHITVSLNTARHIVIVLLVFGAILTELPITAVLAMNDASRLGLALLGQGDVKGATRAFDEALKRDPNDLDSLLGMAQALRQNQEPQKAVPYLKKVLQLQPTNRVALLALVDVLNWDERARSESMALLTSYIDAHPADLKARRQLGMMASWSKKNHPIAIKQLKIVIKTDPRDLEAMLALAGVLNWSESWRDAEGYFRRYLKAKPDDYKVRLELADLLSVEKNNVKEAIAEYDKAIKDHPDVMGRLSRALCFAWHKAAEKAFPEIKKLATENPNMMVDGAVNGQKRKVPLILLAAQVAAYSKPGHNESERCYRLYLKRYPSDKAVRFELAKLLNVMRRPSYALSELNYILEQDPHDTQARVEKTMILLNQNQLAKAMPELRKLTTSGAFSLHVDLYLQGKMRKVPVIVALAHALDQAGQTKEAEAVFHRYLVKRPADVIVRKELDDIKKRPLHGGGAPYDLAAVEKVLARNPENPTSRLQKGLILMSKGSAVEAMGELSFVLSKSAYLPAYFWMQGRMRERPAIVALALAAEQAGEFKEAELAFRKYLAQNPNDVAVRLELASMLNNQSDIASKQQAIDELTYVISLKEQGEDSALLKDQARLIRALTLVSLKEHDKAISELDNLIQERADKPELPYGRIEKMTPTTALAVALLSAKQASEAEVLLRNYLLSPSKKDDLLAMRLLAEALNDQMEKKGEALTIIDKILSKYPDDFFTLRLKAETLNSLGRYDQAIQELNSLIEQKPADQYLRRALAVALYKTQRKEESRKQLEEALKFNPDSPDLVISLAEYYAELGRIGDSERILRQAVEKLPNHSGLYAKLAAVIAQTNRLSEAGRYALKSLKLARENEIESRIADFVGSPQARPLAVMLLKELLAQNPNHPDHLLTLGNIQTWEDATKTDGIKYLKRYLELRPDDWKTRRYLADVLSWTAQRQEAAQIYHSLIASQPDNADLRLGLARVEVADKVSIADGIKDYEIYLKMRPGDHEARRALADAYNWAGILTQSARAYQELLKEKPEDASLLLGLARAEIGIKSSRQDGIKHFEEYLKKNPDDKQSRRFLADNLGWSGQPKKAVVIYEELVNDTPGDLDLEADYAKHLLSSDKVSKATSIFKSILAKNPNHRTALVGLADLYSQSGDFFKAEKLLSKARKLYPNDLPAAMSSVANFRAIGRADKASEELRRCQSMHASN